MKLPIYEPGAAPFPPKVPQPLIAITSAGIFVPPGRHGLARIRDFAE